MDQKERTDQLTTLRDALLAIADRPTADCIAACIDDLMDFKIATFERNRDDPFD